MEGGELGRRGQVSECELSLEMHDVVGTLECWMGSGGWRASFPFVASDHRHYSKHKKKKREYLFHWGNLKKNSNLRKQQNISGVKS